MLISDLSRDYSQKNGEFEISQVFSKPSMNGELEFDFGITPAKLRQRAVATGNQVNKSVIILNQPVVLFTPHQIKRKNTNENDEKHP